MNLLKELTEARYAQDKRLPLKLAKLFKSYFELEDELDDTGYGEWYPLDGITARWDDDEPGYNEVHSISGPDDRGMFDVHAPEDGPYATAQELIDNLYFTSNKRI